MKPINLTPLPSISVKEVDGRGVNFVREVGKCGGGWWVVVIFECGWCKETVG